MKKTFLTILMCVLLVGVLALAGCTEKTKQDAIETDFAAASTVVSNGGLAVNVGNKYLYFINGYADIGGENTFGAAVKGAVARVDLVNGKPDTSTFKIIVPKNVYNTVATSGLVVSGEYLYYTCPSLAKNASGEAKTNQMVLMRTRLDGTDTAVIANFSDYTPVYKVQNNYLMYFNSEAELHVIDLGTKNFKDTLVDKEIASYKFGPYSDTANSMTDTAFYIKASENRNESHNVIWAYRAGGTPTKLIDGYYSYKDMPGLEHPAGYTLALLDVAYMSGNVARLIYTKTDSSSNAISKGDYYCDFNADLSFAYNKEVRITRGVNYTAYRFLDSTGALAVSASGIDFVAPEAGSSVYAKTELIVLSSVTLVDVAVSADSVKLYYLASSKLNVINVLTASEEGSVTISGVKYKTDLKDTAVLFSESYDTAWLTLDKIGDCIYYFKTDVLKNIYYLDLSAVTARDARTMIGRQLGKFSREDNYQLATGSAWVAPEEE